MRRSLLYTIGFTQKPAETFFSLLRANGVRRLVDIRANNTSQLSGFTKRDDLAYFLHGLLGVEYYHMDFLAPTQEIRKANKDSRHGWSTFERLFLALMEARGIVDQVDRAFFTEAPCCLLCSEPTPDHCHRRLVAERLQQAWPELEIIHL